VPIAGLQKADIDTPAQVIDAVTSSIYIFVILMFVCSCTKKDVKFLESQIEDWLTGRLLPEPGSAYLRLSVGDRRRAIKAYKQNEIEMQELEQSRRKKRGKPEIFMDGGNSRNYGEKLIKKKEDLKAMSYYLLEHPYVEGNRYRGRSTMWFHLFMVFVGLYYSMIFGGWVT
jgi:hypothetical protein